MTPMLQSPKQIAPIEKAVGDGVVMLKSGFEGRRFEDGIINETYRVDRPEGPQVLKVYHPKNRANAEKEAAMLAALQGSLPVPRLGAHGDVLVPGRTALLMEYFPYPNARQIRPRLAKDFYISAAETLGIIHAEKVTRSLQTSLTSWNKRHIGVERVQPFDQFCQQAESWLHTLARDGAASVAELAVLFNRMQRHARFFCDSALAVVHGDYSMANLLTDGTRVSAVLDFERMTIGDPGWDLHYFSQIIVDAGLSSTFVTAFLAAYERVLGLPPYFEERRNFYRYYRGFQRAIRHRYIALQRKAPDRAAEQKIYRFLKNLVDYSDPWLSSGERGIL